MWPFKKKKIFKITWRYSMHSSFPPSVDCIKAADLPTAWAKIRRLEKAHTITLVDWEEVI